MDGVLYTSLHSFSVWNNYKINKNSCPEYKAQNTIQKSLILIIVLIILSMQSAHTAET